MSRTHLPIRNCGPVVILTLIVAAGGCTSKTTESRKAVHPVSGKVFVQKRPAVGAELVFYPVNEPPDPTDPRPGATVGADGSFTLNTGGLDGAPAGEYFVTIVWPGRAIPDAPEDVEDKLFGRYADPQRSKLRVTLKEGKNELEPFRL